MRDPKLFRRISSEILRTSSHESIPKHLHAAIVDGVKGVVTPLDFSDALKTMGDAFGPVTFTHATLTLKDLSHELIAWMMDPDASLIRYIRIEHDNGDKLHAIVAPGGNPMGFILDDDGSTLYRIYDGEVDNTTSSTISAEQIALRALVFEASDGDSVSDVKQQIRDRDEGAFEKLW